ncbi:MAG: ATP-binding protein [Thermodesulfobacteriota bacterium]|nr:ATP-binding protein [Thermodesulfobacteriota bacterium]
MRITYPFTALVAQEELQLGLILNAINPKIGGMLIRGEKGTAKSTAVRALADILPDNDVVKDCMFNCDPAAPAMFCHDCQKRVSEAILPTERKRIQVVELPINATEDRVAGTLDLEHALKKGEKRFEPGLLAQAHRGILYVDEVNLLDDHIVDILLDSAAMGVNTVEREGVSYTHKAEFILVGTMNPEEGDLRPQLLDRFGLCVSVYGIKDLNDRMKIVSLWNEFEADPVRFCSMWDKRNKALIQKISEARTTLADVTVSEVLLKKITKIAIEAGVDGHRADLVMMKASKTHAAFAGRTQVNEEDVFAVAGMSLRHRVRRGPFDHTELDMEVIKSAMQG